MDTTDIAVTRHPEHGIVATNPRDLPAGHWMLERLGFHPVPDQLKLFALTDQPRSGRDHAAQAVRMLRSAGYSVAADTEFEPNAPIQPRPLHRLAEPDVAFAEHPRLGVVAATAGTASAAVRGGQVLEQHGWRHNAQLDIYTLPITTDRGEALGLVAQATTAMRRADLLVAVEPRLAQDAATGRAPGPAAADRREDSRGLSSGRFPLSAAALSASPATAGLPGKAPVPVPAPAAASPRPLDPRIAMARTR
ncbi:hypothetical protein [Kitasatospora sp. McL0602]|uniref:hypothetical protein n=1 Tax=Kitasatospora sp. McL0602 TaxID=3439530 RepID=UPI003F8BB065